MHHRDGIRPRPIDDHKQYLILKDLDEVKKTVDRERQIQIAGIEEDLYRIIDFFDKKKRTQIPKAKIINEKNDKNENNVNYNINNNIIYNTDKNDTSNQNNSKYILNFKLSEYKRPDSYIIYSSSVQNKINANKKLYEATEADKIFLNIRENFMKLEELENIIIDLENNCTNEKDDKINEESARKIIETKYSKYVNYIDSIITHFKDRRSSIKKSFIRKKWHKNKSTDKFLTNTFKKRTAEKRQTRKSNQNKEDSLNKIIEAENHCKSYLSNLMKDMLNKELSNKTLLKVEEFIFQSEIEKIKKTSVSLGRIKENNLIKEKIEKNMKIFKEKESSRKIAINDKAKDHINNSISINKSSLNEINVNQNENNNEIKSSIMPGNIINKPDDINIKNKPPINDIKSTINSSIDSNSINTKKNGGKRGSINKNPSKTKGLDFMPNLSLNSLLDNNISLNEDNNKNNAKKNKTLRMRIRINRNNQIVIDRYIQAPNDFDPFNDSFNNIFAGYKALEKSELQYLNNNNFENLFNSYNMSKLNDLNIISDSDDEDANNDLKQFSNSYKQFLKLKRAQTK